MNTKDFGPVKQLGYLVEDIEASVNAWMDHLNVGPWMIIKNVTLDCTFKGEPSAPLIDIALAYSGDVQVELIQQKNDAQSPYRKYFDEKRMGLHHTAYLCDDINKDVDQAVDQGLDVVCDINMFDGSRYVYAQNAALGEDIYIEFLENTDIMKEMFKSGIENAANWDGNRDIVVMDLAPADEG